MEPLYNKPKNVQLLETEKGYIRDVGINIFDGMNAELHLGVREDSLKATLTKMRNITVPLIMFVIFIGVIASFFMSRLITEPPLIDLLSSQRFLVGENLAGRLRLNQRMK